MRGRVLAWCSAAAFAALLLPAQASAPAAANTFTAASGAHSSSGWKPNPKALGHIKGIVPRVARGQAGRSGAANPWCRPACTPPLLFTRGAPVMGGLTRTPGFAIVSLVYWAPAGFQYTATYKQVVDPYLSDLALAAGQPSNDFAQMQQYYQQSLTAGAPIQRIHPQIQVGNEVADTHPYPVGDPSACLPDVGFTACVTDAELQNELIAMGVPEDDAHVYAVLFPQGVESCVGAGSASSTNPCSTNAFCAYHSGAAVGAGQNVLLYTNQPFPDLKTCVDPVNGPQAPNGDAEADTQVSLLSHELNETVTDWAGAWMDSSGFENGDECAYVYGSVQGTAGGYYNQALGSHHYYTQDEFSNEDFAKGAGDTTVFNGQTVTVAGCTQVEELPTASFTGPGAIETGATATFDASASSDPDVAGGLSYDWTWGDQSPHGSGLSASHTYCTAGNYTVTLRVTDIDDWQNTSTASLTVTQTAPIVSTISPSYGPVGGGTAVTITGCGFTPTSTVSFGPASAVSVTFVSDRQILATTPPQASAVVDVTVTSSAGSSAKSPADQFTFQQACPTGTNGSAVAGDFEGAGHADLALTPSSDVCVLQASSSSFLPSALWSAVPFYGSLQTLAGDVNGDGKADLVALNSGSTWVLPSQGHSFGSPTQWSGVPFYGSIATFVTDVNGDGKADLVAVNRDSVWVMLSTGSGFLSPVEWSSAHFYGAVTTVVGDVNGDGKPDLIAINRDSTWVLTSTGSGFAPPIEWASQPFYGARTTFVADLNGDGKVDLVALNNGDIWVMTSNGTAFSAPTRWSSTPFYGSLATLPADLNGDKKQDLVAFNGSTVWVELSTGTGFGAPSEWL
jgi:PKD domain/FG-GAP-like repeat/IPT/TIG domain